MASDISGSHTSGFNYTGTLIGTQTCGGPGAWSLGASRGFEQSNAGSGAVGQSPNAMLAHYGTGGDVLGNVQAKVANFAKQEVPVKKHRKNHSKTS